MTIRFASESFTRHRSGSISSRSSGAPPLFDDLAPQRAPTTVSAEETSVDLGRDGLEVRLKVDAGPGCGGIAWPAGEVLSRYLTFRDEMDPAYLAGKTILELGSGTGLVGIAAGLISPTAKIWVTDQAPLLDLMCDNVDINLPSGSNVRVAELNWGDPVSNSIPVDDLDVILAADCVYFEPAFPLLVDTLCTLAPVGKAIEILFCWKKRRKVDDDRPGAKERYNREGVTLLRLIRRK